MSNDGRDSLYPGDQENKILLEKIEKKYEDFIGEMIKEGSVLWLSLRTALYKPYDL